MKANFFTRNDNFIIKVAPKTKPTLFSNFMKTESIFVDAFTLYVGQNLFTTSCLLSSTVLWSNKLMIKKNDAVAVGPYDTCSISVFISAVRTFVTGHMCDVNFTQPYSVGATYNEPYNENCKHFCQSYVSVLDVCLFDWLMTKMKEKTKKLCNFCEWTAVSCTRTLYVYVSQVAKKVCYPIVCQPSFVVWYFPLARLYCKLTFLLQLDACLGFVSWCSMPFFSVYLFMYVCIAVWNDQLRVCFWSS